MAKKEEFPEDFRYLVRISSTDLDGKRSVANALTGIKGVHQRLSRVIVKEAGVDKDARIGTLSDADIDKLQQTVLRVAEFTPTWMRNRRRDPSTGADDHHIGTEIELVLRDDLNTLKKIRSWKGMRHERHLPVRGQRTKANGRTGATVGVQRKK